MGNALSATSAAEILPVEKYINDIADEDSIESLGSTRFMKVAHARTNEGHQVLKVFIIPEDTPILEPYQKEIIQIRDALENALNCCTVRKILKRPKYAVLFRPFQKYTLYDRLSTRPFIVETERLWYIYQLFRALLQCQEAGVCHGDIKSQNVLISSTNWLQITDFASFKPTFLPIDNPSSFTFYFDTSRRQTCYIAPERFLSNEEFGRVGNNTSKDTLRHSMDMFSSGCVVYELLCDGKPAFIYGELCVYREMNNTEAAQHIERLLAPVPSPFRPLLKILLSREPSLRPNATQVLAEFSHLFPSYFSEKLYDYMEMFRPNDDFRATTASTSIDYLEPTNSKLALEPDEVILKISSDSEMLFSRLSTDEQSSHCAVLFVSLLTSHVRSLRSVPVKVTAMRLLVRFSKLAGPGIATERVLPYLVHMMQSEGEGQVRGASLGLIVDLLEHFTPSTLEDSLVFIDFLLPRLDSIAQDLRRNDTFLLMAIAVNMGRIAEIAYRFMMDSRHLRGSTLDDETSGAENLTDAAQFAQESSTLYKSITDIFTHLCSRGNEIKHCLTKEESFRKLHEFCVNNRYPNFLLSHIVTFLNIKGDWRLRAVFFDALPVCVHKKSVDVRALLEQGLHDFEEMVVVSAMHCISILCERDLFEKGTVVGLLNDLIPFLAHPNEWIRSAVVDFLTILDRKWTMADVHCRLIPKVNEYTKEKLIRLNNKIVIMYSLHPPIPRELWRKLTELSVNKTAELCRILEELSMKKLVGEPNIPDHTLGKLFDLGLKEDIHLKRMANFRPLLQKMAEFRKTSCESAVTHYNGSIDLTGDAYKKVNQHTHVLGDPISSIVRNPIPCDPRLNEIYGGEGGRDMGRSGNIPRQMRISMCDVAVNELLDHKNAVYTKSRGRRESCQPRVSHSNFVSSQLITHLHEHSGKITQMSIQPSGERFASASTDGTVKIWSARQVSGECYGAVRSETTFNYNKNHSVLGVGWACDGQVLCTTSNDGRVLWADVASSSEHRITSMVTIPKEEGVPEQLYVCGQMSYVRSHHGVVYCLDYRVGHSNGSLKKHEVWRREMPNKHGKVTSFVIDPVKENWMVLTATNCVAMLWDLRYPLEVNYWSTGKVVPLNVWSLPMQTADRDGYGPEVLIGMAVRGEIASYELHSADRKRILWPSMKQPGYYLGAKDIEDDFSTVTTALTCSADTEYIYSGDSLGALRRWNLRKPQNCEYLSGPRRPDGEFTRPHKVVYEMTMVDGRIPTLCEKKVENQLRRDSRVGLQSPMETKVSTTHRTAISSVLCLPNNLLASSSCEGVIKIWK